MRDIGHFNKQALPGSHVYLECTAPANIYCRCAMLDLSCRQSWIFGDCHRNNGCNKKFLLKKSKIIALTKSTADW